MFPARSHRHRQLWKDDFKEQNVDLEMPKWYRRCILNHAEVQPE